MIKSGCVILAAGKNTRLDTGKPKTLLKINGQTLLERHIHLFANYGVDHFCVITGHNKGAIEEEIQRILSVYPVTIDSVFNDQFELENGLSVYKSQEWVRGKGLKSFLLTMADHVFNGSLISTFTNAEKDFHTASLYLAVDKPGPHNQHIDIDDVTKVLGKEGLISNIGKEITDYNYFDTGLFEMSLKVFDAFEACFAKQQYSISNMVYALAAMNKAALTEVIGSSWNDVDNLDDYQNSLDLSLD
ncbi:MAG: NTP transferase domain-containing protein [Cyclobacteriaceae bacterium]